MQGRVTAEIFNCCRLFLQYWLGVGLVRVGSHQSLSQPPKVTSACRSIPATPCHRPQCICLRRPSQILALVSLLLHELAGFQLVDPMLYSCIGIGSKISLLVVLCNYALAVFSHDIGNCAFLFCVPT